MNVAKKEPAPINGKDPVWKEVMNDIITRVDFGHSKYKTVLKTFDGRDSLMDIYQELIDGIIYIKQAMMEKEVLKEKLKDSIRLVESSSYSNQDSIAKAVELINEVTNNL